MRRLNSHDVFTCCRLLKKVNAKELLEAFMNSAQDEAAGIDLLFGCMAELGEAEDEFLRFISGPMEISAADLKDMDFFEFKKKLEDLLDVVDVEMWRGFFSSAQKMMDLV